jgi:hypothetical protein
VNTGIRKQQEEISGKSEHIVLLYQFSDEVLWVCLMPFLGLTHYETVQEELDDYLLT